MKHKNLKRITGMLLSAVLIIGSLAGCSGKISDGGGGENSTEKDAKEQAMGRFLEEEMAMPAELMNIYDMKKLEDGTIRLAGSDEKGINSVWDSKDKGESWEKGFDFPEKYQDEEKGYIDYAALSGDGQTAFVFNKIEDNGIRPVVCLLDKSGNGSEIPYEFPQTDMLNTAYFTKDAEGNEDSPQAEKETGAEDDSMPKEEENSSMPKGEKDGSAPEEDTEIKNMDGTGNLAMDIKFLGNDQILVQDIQDNIYQVSIADDSVKQTYEFDGMTESHQFYVVGKTIVVQSSSEVLLYDSETGQQQSTDEALQKSVSESGTFTAMDTMDQGKSVYGLSAGGLYHYKFGGSVVEQLIDGSMNSLGGPSFYVSALAMLDEQNLLVAANDSNADSASGIVLLKFTYSADVPAKPSKELKVYSLYDNRELRQAISRFQKEHTDIYVNFEVALSEENGVTVSDALKTLTTEIMAGEGPDVLLLDGMSVETYVEKGILKDIASLVNENENDYFGSVLNAYKDESGQLCAVPARFLIPMIQAGSGEYTAGEDFDTFTDRAGVLANMVPKEVIEKFWYSCGSAWQKEDGTLEEAKITEFLEKLKNAYGEYDSDMDEDTGVSVAYHEAGGAAKAGNVSRLQGTDIGEGMFELAYGRLKSNVGLFGGSSYDMLLAVNKMLEGGDYGIMPGQAENVFVPSMIMGISSKSNQTEVAEEFVKYLFSKEAQSVSQGGGLPVEKSAFRSAIDGHEYENTKSLVAVAGGDEMDEMISYEMVPRTEEEIKKLTDLAESLTTPALQNEVIKDAVTEQGEKVLKGELSPQEAAAAIMQKINIYLAE